MHSPFAIEQEAAPDNRRRSTFGHIARGALAMLLPGITREELSDRVSRRQLILICSGTALFMAAVMAAFFALRTQQTKTTRHAATRFATALVRDDEALAPAGGSNYIGNLRTYFGPVTSAAVIATHNHEVNTGDANYDRTYYAADLLLRTRRGPAVVELAFDNQSLSSERISGVRELAPSQVSGLAAAARTQLTAAFAASGGKAASEAALSAIPESGALPTPSSSPATRLPAPAGPKPGKHAPAVPAGPQLTTAATQLACVRDAHGDVARLQKCAR